MAKNELILIGGGGHCRSCIDVIEAIDEYTIAGIVEQDGYTGDSDVFGYPILGRDSDLPKLRERYEYALITLGQIRPASPRKKIHQSLRKMDFAFPILISPRAYCSPNATVAPGTIVMHDSLINVGATIGENCIINTKALIEHDASVGAHSHISTGAIVNGSCRIGEECFLGSQSVCVHDLELPARSFVKAGQLQKS